LIEPLPRRDRRRSSPPLSMQPQPLPTHPGRSLEAPVGNPRCVALSLSLLATPAALLVVLRVVLKYSACRGAAADERGMVERGRGSRPSRRRRGRRRAALLHWLSQPAPSWRGRSQVVQPWPCGIRAAFILRGGCGCDLSSRHIHSHRLYCRVVKWVPQPERLLRNSSRTALNREPSARSRRCHGSQVRSLSLLCLVCVSDGARSAVRG